MRRLGFSAALFALVLSACVSDDNAGDAAASAQPTASPGGQKPTGGLAGLPALPGGDEQSSGGQAIGGSVPGKDLFVTHQPGSGTPFQLGNTAAYDACTVLPMSKIQDAGLELDPYYLITHDYMERNAPGDDSQAQINLEGLSNCSWWVVGDQDVTLQIYQPPFSHPSDREDRLDFQDRSGATERSSHGLQIFTMHGGDNDPTQWQVSLFAKDYWALLLLKLTEDSYSTGSPEEVVNTLVDGVAQRLAAGPTGPANFGYGGPFYADFPHPCSLFTREDFQQTYGEDDTGRVSEGFTGGDQGLDGTVDGAHPPARYIRTTCGRKALGQTLDDTAAAGLEVEFHVFPDAEQAGTEEYVYCDPASDAADVFGPPKPINAAIGDGSVCMPDFGRDNRSLVYRKGRTIVLLNNWLYEDARDLDALAAKLTPVARTIADRLPG